MVTNSKDFPIDVFVNVGGEITILQENPNKDPDCIVIPIDRAEEICNAILAAAIEIGNRNG